MKKLSRFVLAAVAILLMVSCKTPKNVAYIQNSDTVDLSKSEYLYDAHIMPKDILTITVNTVNPEAARPFNLLVHNTLNKSGNNLGTNGGSLTVYLVDNEGFIEFPIVGKLKVGGLTIPLCEKLVHDKIQRFMNAEEDPIVTVRMTNYKISVLGEVNKPGMFTISNEKVSIFEALALAGDLSIYGIRDRVKLIREDSKGRKEIHTVSLNDANIVNSPYYYLQQNDIVYVEPNSVKARNSAIGTSTTIWISVTGALVSLASLIVNILR